MGTTKSVLLDAPFSGTLLACSDRLQPGPNNNNVNARNRASGGGSCDYEFVWRTPGAYGVANRGRNPCRMCSVALGPGSSGPNNSRDHSHGVGGRGSNR